MNKCYQCGAPRESAIHATDSHCKGIRQVAHPFVEHIFQEVEVLGELLRQREAEIVELEKALAGLLNDIRGWEISGLDVDGDINRAQSLLQRRGNKPYRPGGSSGCGDRPKRAEEVRP